MQNRFPLPVAAELSFALLLSACTPSARRASGPLPHEAYVWQRTWTPAVTESIAANAKAFQSLTVLGAEVSWRAGQPKITRARIDPTTLRSAQLANCPIGIALRIGPHSGPFSNADKTSSALAELAKALVDEYETNGVSAAEIQIDFDCASAKLDGYVLWLQAFRERMPHVPLAITVLPDWISRPAFSRLVAVVDSFILQVHSIERPKHPEDRFDLCDVTAARKSVERAARFEKRFRVALPTYGYTVAFDHQGKFHGLSADGPEVLWPPGTILRKTMANPHDMAQLVTSWTTSHPEMLTGIIWYRLPVNTDSLNWSWPTLAAVMQGRSPQPVVSSELSSPAPGLVEVILANQGENSAAALPGIALGWPAGRCIAGDGLGGFQLDTRSGREAYLTSAAARELKPGERRKIAWLRFDRAVVIQMQTF